MTKKGTGKSQVDLGTTKSAQAKAGTPVQWLTVDSEQVSQRLDNFLMSRLKGVPRSKLYALIRSGELRVNKGRKKPSYRLQLGDQVRIPPLRLAGTPSSARQSSQFQSFGLKAKDWVLYEDKGLLVVNKPSGLAVHGGSGLSFGLIEQFRAHFPEHQYLELVHRLDRGTSGLILLAKRASVLKSIQAQLREQRLDKTYYALLSGRPERKNMRVDAPLMKNVLRSGERQVQIQADGKPSMTDFDVLETLDCGVTLVRAKPYTGRTHQIRVHAQSLGCSILNDDKYGGEPIMPSLLHQLSVKLSIRQRQRLMLHAFSLRFEYAGELRSFYAPLPPLFDALFGHTSSWSQITKSQTAIATGKDPMKR